VLQIFAGKNMKIKAYITLGLYFRCICSNKAMIYAVSTDFFVQKNYISTEACSFKFFIEIKAKTTS